MESLARLGDLCCHSCRCIKEPLDYTIKTLTIGPLNSHLFSVTVRTEYVIFQTTTFEVIFTTITGGTVLRVTSSTGVSIC